MTSVLKIRTMGLIIYSMTIAGVPNVSTHQNRLEDSLTCTLLGLIPRAAYSGGPGWGLRNLHPNKFLGDADAEGLGTTL